MKVRLLALLSAAGLLILGAVPASASSEGHPYLALGDSVAFGTSEIKNPAVLPASAFSGYPDVVARALNVKVVNPSCPGEATGGFIDPMGLDNVCRFYKSHFPLHVNYSGETQLQFAVNFLKANPRTRLVTIDLDANDLFRESTGPGPDFWPPSTCFVPAPATPADLGLYFSTCVVQNLKTIFGALRGTGYKGLIVALTYYSLDYSDAVGTAGTKFLLNAAMVTAAAPFGVKIASGFDAFAAATSAFGGHTCAAGLLVVESTNPLVCGIHPSDLGHQILGKTVVDAIAATCPAANPIGCLNRNQAS
jgi:lysophospholipase L1-like esterase